MMPMLLTMIQGAKQTDSSRQSAGQVADGASFAANFQEQAASEPPLHAGKLSAEVPPEDLMSMEEISGETVMKQSKDPSAVQLPEDERATLARTLSMRGSPVVQSSAVPLPKPAPAATTQTAETEAVVTTTAGAASSDKPLPLIDTTTDMQASTEKPVALPAANALASQPVRTPAVRGPDLSKVGIVKPGAESTKTPAAASTTGTKDTSQAKMQAAVAGETAAVPHVTDLAANIVITTATSGQAQTAEAALQESVSNVKDFRVSDPLPVQNKTVSATGRPKGQAADAAGPVNSSRATTDVKPDGSGSLDPSDTTTAPANSQSLLHSAALPAKADEQTTPILMTPEIQQAMTSMVHGATAAQKDEAQVIPASANSGNSASVAAQTAPGAPLPASGADHVVLAATPVRLEVGLVNGAHGWVKIRTEMSEDGQVSAALSAGSASGLAMLHRELPALTGYLQGTQVAVSSLVVDRTVAAPQNGAALAGGGVDGGQAQQQASQRTPDLEADPKTLQVATEDVGMQEEVALSGGGRFAPGLLEGSGSWLNVRV